MRMGYHMQDPAGMTLDWKVYSGGRLLIATAVVGYFEMELGGRVRHVRFGTSGLQATDLGPCSQGTLIVCMAMCDDYQRTALSCELPHA
jgi:hypothetical protein